MLTDEEKKTKDFKTFKRLVGCLLAETYSMYGYQEYAAGVADVITELAVILVKRRMGQHIPMTLQIANGRLSKRYKNEDLPNMR